MRIINVPWYGVLGYGCDPDGKKIHDYIFFACNLAKNTGQNLGLSALVFSGGFTNPVMFPGLSEAMMMEKIAREMGYIFPIYREEESLNTIQNIRNLKKLQIEDCFEDAESEETYVRLLDPRPLGIICDKDRAFKVAYISRKIFGEKVPVIGFNFGRTAEEKMRIFIGTINDILAIHSPFLENYFLEQRKHEFGIA